MLVPSGGDALLAGHSVSTEAGAVQRARVGLCPQRNVLFEHLTVSEHLQLYGAVRGMSGALRVSDCRFCCFCIDRDSLHANRAGVVPRSRRTAERICTCHDAVRHSASLSLASKSVYNGCYIRPC